MKPAALTVTIKNNSLLLVKRRDVPVWVLPGGGIEAGEEPQEAAIRETLEETGVLVAIMRAGLILHTQSKLASDTSIFLAHPIQGEPLIASKECSEINYFPLDKLPSNLFFLHKKWLQEVLKSTCCIQRPLYEVTLSRALLYLILHPIRTARYLFTRKLKK